MPFIGNKPTSVPLTSSDITDGIITTTKIADANVTNPKLTSGSQQNFRNLIINGDMSQAQRSTSVSSITSSSYNTVDRFRTTISTAGTWTQSQSTDVPTGQGFAKSLKMDCTTADGSLAAGDRLFIEQQVEGQNLQYLKKGTSSAESTTMSFWVKSNKTGTYICVLEDDNSRSISKSYTISSADTWEKKTLTFAGDTSGALDNDNTTGFRVEFWLASGSTYSSGTLNTSWNSTTNANMAVGQVNLADSTSNDWYVTGIQLEAGTSASDFEFLPVDVNLDRCQRYYQALSNGYTITNLVFSCFDSTYAYGTHSFIKTMRTAPTINFNSLGSGNIQAYNNGAERTLSSISASNISKDRVSIDVAGSGWSGGQALHLNNNNTSVPLFTASSEL